MNLQAARQGRASGRPAARKRDRAPAGAPYPGLDPGEGNGTEDEAPEGASQSGSPDHQVPDLAHVLHRETDAFAAEA